MYNLIRLVESVSVYKPIMLDAPYNPISVMVYNVFLIHYLRFVCVLKCILKWTYTVTFFNSVARY